MESPAPDVLLRTFGDAVRACLMDREPVAIGGVGTLSVRHEPSRMVVRDDGSRELHPPRDTVAFDPDA
jgi:nucleoid DNA-binding protein